MVNLSSYSPEEVSKLLKISKGTVYELIKKGDLPSYRVGKKIRVSQSDLEVCMNSSDKSLKIVRGKDQTSIEKLILENQGLIICGQDVILDLLTRYLEKKNPSLRSLRSYIGSIDGMISLYKGAANITAAHLWDSETDEYNTPYVKKIIPGQSVLVINLAYRMQGFYVLKGNPKNIKDWNDLERRDIIFVNREAGCGARVLLDEKLKVNNIDSRRIKGYNNEELSHIAVASNVSRGLSDVGLGIEKAAMQVPGISFISLMKERYDLIMYKNDLEKSNFQTLLSIIRSNEFKEEVEGLGGYDISRMGEILGET